MMQEVARCKKGKDVKGAGNAVQKARPKGLRDSRNVTGIFMFLHTLHS